MIVWYKSNVRWLHKDFVLDFIESSRILRSLAQFIHFSSFLSLKLTPFQYENIGNKERKHLKTFLIILFICCMSKGKTFRSFITYPILHYYL